VTPALFLFLKIDYSATPTGVICPGPNQVRNGNFNYDCVLPIHTAVSQLNQNGKTTYSQGSNLTGTSTSGFDDAIIKAKASDVVILGLGITERKMDVPDGDAEGMRHVEAEGQGEHRTLALTLTLTLTLIGRS